MAGQIGIPTSIRTFIRECMIILFMAKQKIVFNFKIEQTSCGFVASGVELNGIIIESETRDKLNKDLEHAVEHYFEAFPDEKRRLVAEKTEKIQQIVIEI